ncbi:MAG: cardiolipin synthase [Candidatus Dasytiphilus stammeri]
MITFYSFIGKLIFLLYGLFIAAIVCRIFMKRRTVSSSIAWLLTIYLFPFMGIIAYLILEELYLGTRRAKRAQLILPSITQWIKEFKNYKKFFAIKHSEVASQLFQLCELRQGITSVKANQLNLLTSTDEIVKSIIQDIQLARNNIKIVFYIWQPGGITNIVADALITAAKRGVHCRLMLDSAGSRNFFNSTWVSVMRNAGIEIVEVLRVSLLRMFFRRLDLRQHRKMVLIDNYIAYTGSMNLVDPHIFKKAKVGQWIDLMVRMEGPITNMMGIIYSCDWELETGHRILPFQPDIDSSIISSFSLTTSEPAAIHVIASGPDYPDDYNMIHKALLTAIFSARHAIIMTTPYFVPSDDLLHALCIAAQRGVDVSIILPYYNDSILVGWASRVFFTELLKSGVKIYQFEGGLLHTKSVQIDGQLSLIGTVNFDMRSLWLNFEITLVIDNKNFGNDLSFIQGNYITSSRLIDVNSWLRRPYWQRILEQLFYFFSPLL